MRLMVTGISGFIFSNFCHYWNKEHPEDLILGVDRLSYAGDMSNLSEATCDFHHVDCSNADRVSKLPRDVDVLIIGHASSHVDNSITDPGDFIQDNIVGTFNMLEWAKTHKIPKIYLISTDEVLKHDSPTSSLVKGEPVYQFYRKPEFTKITKWRDYYPIQVDQAAELEPSSVYSASKASQEMLASAYRKTWGMDITTVRLTNNYGPRQHKEKLLPKAITNVMNDLPVPIYAAGDQWRDWLYVEDSCRALELIIQKGKPNETYHISAMKEQQNIDVVKQILDKLGKPHSLIQHVTDRLGHDTCYSLDSNLIREEMGWSPRVPFSEGLDKTIEWYRSIS